jgi:phosphoribosylanthranilate isomerase
VLVKICGITRGEDAAAAAEAGAGAIGFIFWPQSPRFVDPYRARRIARALPPFVTPVGVFVNQPLEYVNAVTTLVGLGVVQLHGDEPLDYARAVRRPVLKAISGADLASEAVARWPSDVMLLVDAHDPVRRGGTGAQADWTRAAALAAERPIVLAGGLGVDNIAEAVARVRPFGVDVSSGVEVSPGVKDRQRLAALFAQFAAAPAARGSRA